MSGSPGLRCTTPEDDGDSHFVILANAGIQPTWTI